VTAVWGIGEVERASRSGPPARRLLSLTPALALRTQRGPDGQPALADAGAGTAGAAGAGADLPPDATTPVPVLDGGPGDTDLFTARGDLPKRTPRPSPTGPLPAVHHTGPIPAIGYEDESDGRAPDDPSPQGITPG